MTNETPSTCGRGALSAPGLRIRKLGASGATLCLLLLAGCSGASPSTTLGTLADSGFNPDANGFPFANYGNYLTDGTAPTNLTSADMRQMFGNQVCTDPDSQTCRLTPEAQAWERTTNSQMAGGHCYGFSVAAELLWQHKLKASTLGAPATDRLEIDDNSTLQRLIAYDWALQLLDSVRSHQIGGSPDEILATLEKALEPNPTDTYTLTIFKADGSGGHAVTPYKVVNKGGGHYVVSIYDNNWPGQDREISFDTETDSWQYYAATNPGQESALYKGNADSHTMFLMPTSPGLGKQPCPFCGKEPDAGHSASTVRSGSAGSAGSGASGGTEEIYLLGSDTEHADLVVTDSSGHRIGDVNGRMVDHVHGAQVDALAAGDWQDDLAPDLVVPADAGYTITLDGTGLSGPVDETLGLVGPSYDLSVDDIPISPGDRDTFVTTADGTELRYTGSNPQTPTLELGVSDDRADYSFDVSGLSDQPGGTLELQLPTESGTLTVDETGTARASTVDLKMTRYTSQGVQVFGNDSIRLQGGDTARFEFGNWRDPAQGIPLVTTYGGMSSTEMLTDQGASAGS